ncbi:hypothetical protein BD289DRAFT_377079, partial [Coniella lustricola]
AALKSKEFHGVFEAIFRATVADKQTAMAGAKGAKSAADRLGLCGKALRATATLGISKLKPNTLRAVIDHILDTLPDRNGELYAPLAREYAQTLAVLLGYSAHVENLAISDASGWLACADFAITGILRLIEGSKSTSSATASSDRDSPAGSFAPPPSVSNVDDRRLQAVSRRVSSMLLQSELPSLVECLSALMSASNAPYRERSKEIYDLVILLLRLRIHSQRLHRMLFAILNGILLHSVGEGPETGRAIAADVVPLLRYCWQPRAIDNDEMLFSVRDEMLKTMHGVQLYIDSLLQDGSSSTLLNDLEDLLDTLWAEYSRRSQQSRLRQEDLTFSSTRVPAGHFSTPLFAIRPLAQDAERRWAMVETMSCLEIVFLRHTRTTMQHPEDTEEQPRKRQRLSGGTIRVQQKMSSHDDSVQLTALQLLPFYLSASAISPEDWLHFVDNLIPMISDKQGFLSSWAMIACASFILLPQARHTVPETKWTQVWQLAFRAVSMPNTCRAACVLIHTLVEAQMLPQHAIADDVSNIITMADICGPPLLVDSSLVLMHSLANLQNEIAPSAIQKTYSHIIRWAFSTWKPAEMAHPSSCSANMTPPDLLNLLFMCCGLSPLELIEQVQHVGGPIAQFWKAFNDSVSIARYLLLLKDEVISQPNFRRDLSQSLSSEVVTDDPMSSSSQNFRTLVLELLYPKLDELAPLLEANREKGGRRSVRLSAERFTSFLACVVSSIILLPSLQSQESRIAQDVRSLLNKLWDWSIQLILEAPEMNDLFELVLLSFAPYLPSLDPAQAERFCGRHPDLLERCVELCGFMESYDSALFPGQHTGRVKLDEGFESQVNNGNIISETAILPRHKLGLQMSRAAFLESTRLKIHLLSAYSKDPNQIGLMPEATMDSLLALPDDRFLLAGGFLHELLQSHISNASNYARDIIEQIGGILRENRYSTCEAVLCLCADVLASIAPLWSLGGTDSDLINPSVDLYNFLVKTALPNCILSTEAQISLSGLLYRLMEINSKFWEDKRAKVDAPRTTLLDLLSSSGLRVKFGIGQRLTEFFELYTVKLHENIFNDVLKQLPVNSADMEGIAYRIFVLATLGCKLPTLLRRSVYHIFEVPRMVPSAGSRRYATWGMKAIAKSRLLKSQSELLQLFAPQVLYTLLEKDEFEDIPFEIFGFDSLGDLLSAIKTEAVAQMVMRGQWIAIDRLAARFRMTPVQIVQESFSKAMAYSTCFDIASKQELQGEAGIKRLLGDNVFFDTLNRNFVDIVGHCIALTDQEDPVEISWAKDEPFSDASAIMSEIKQYSRSPTELPHGQQPHFRAKFLVYQLAHIASQTQYDVLTLWTPPLIVSVARRLLNTIHLALGPHHALSVVRKLRILICLAGRHNMVSYPLEMLLRSLRPFLSEAECADDALGISQWLIAHGTAHLARAPSFFAEYALSTLANLRIFLESSQASSSQESQFKATMSKAQQFHTWLVKLLKGYESSAFKSETQAQAFKAITTSASNIRTSGNSQKDSHESRLLLEILKDAERDDQLLNDAARNLALRMLCGEFTVAPSYRDDILESDADACIHGPMVWKSCRAVQSSKEFLTWAGRVVGKFYAASGEIPQDALKESLLSSYLKTTTSEGDSIHGILRLLADLTISDNSSHASLAESALRRVVSFALATEDHDLIADCRRSLPETLFACSAWSMYHIPLTDLGEAGQCDRSVFEIDKIESHMWAQHLAIHLAQALQESPILRGLSAILDEVDGFAEQSLPYIVHLVLLGEFDSRKSIKKSLSTATKGWLESQSSAATPNIKLLINVIIYLRSRTFPGEVSVNDRSRWLEIDSAILADAAARCGMSKIALMFAELAISEASQTSRRSSAARDVQDHSELLLSIFETIDDPDAYYGLERTASLSNVMARLEYEKEGSKSLAFRGAQYDSHLRSRSTESVRDAQHLVQTLSSLGLAGLSESLLQTHQYHDDTKDILNTAFTTARRLEKWNLPAPLALENHAAMSYRAYQAIYKAVDLSHATTAVRDGLASTMKHLTTKGFKSSDLRRYLGTLAALTELDDVLCTSEPEDLDRLLSNFEARSSWMLIGRYDDVSQILSHRQTTFSLFSQKESLRTSKVTSLDARLGEVRSMLLSSSIYRSQQASQEALSISTTLRDLLVPTEAIGLSVDGAVRMAEAASLWDYGEMISSIRLLQGVHENSASLKKQNIGVSHAEVLSKIGYQVSVARLESVDNIQKKYLETSLKALKGAHSGKEAGQVFHQFATFCDEQLQDSEMREDLNRLQRLVQTRAGEVGHYTAECARASNSQIRLRYQKYLDTTRKYLKLEQDELDRAQKTHNEFVRLSLENFLQSLAASDDHDGNALRFTALWLERSENDFANRAVSHYLKNVPTRKFAPLMNQLSSRLQLDNNPFQSLLTSLVYRLCCDHPYHGMYQIWVGCYARPNKQDEVAVSRKEAAKRIASQLLQTSGGTSNLWRVIDKVAISYHLLADRGQKSKSGEKINVKDSKEAMQLASCFTKYRIPPPTLEIELSPSKDYSNVPVMTKLEPVMGVAGGVSAPKILTVHASNGQRYKQLVKGSNDDLRQDAIMEQVFAAVSALLRQHRSTRQRNLVIRTYKVLPLTNTTGIIEFVANTQPLHDWLIPAHARYYPKDLKMYQCRKEITQVHEHTASVRLSVFRKVTERFSPVMRYFFLESFPDPDDWYVKRLAYTRSTAAISMLGHVLGLGDRHGHNILLDKNSGEVVHIDLGVAFEAGRILPIPEVVPFRMTRDIVDGMGVTKTDGVFRRCCEFTLDALREETYSIMTILDVLRYDPLHSWSSTPVRLAKLQHAARQGGDDEEDGNDGSVTATELGAVDKKKVTNEPSEADRALEVVKKKLSKTLSVTATVNELINQATDERNLAMLFSGWAAFA